MPTTTIYPSAITGGDTHVVIQVDDAGQLLFDVNRKFTSVTDARAWAERWHSERGLEMEEV